MSNTINTTRNQDPSVWTRISDWFTALAHAVDPDPHEYVHASVRSLRQEVQDLRDQINARD